MKKILTLLTMVASFTMLLLSSAALAASSNDKLFGACDQVSNNTVCQSRNTSQNPVIHVINVAADVIALIAGLTAVIMIIISGLSMITSSGKEEAVANARKRLIAALIGLAVIALAWAIVRYVTDNLVQ